MLEVILKQEVRSLGDRGEIVRVAPGYARNYLYPRQLAMPATAANKKQIEEMQAAANKEAARKGSEAEQLAEVMEDVTVRVVERAGEGGQLFGSVTVRDIAAKLAEQGYEVDRQQIILERPLKDVGDYSVRVHLYRDVNVTVKVEVRAEGREDEPLVQRTEEEDSAPAMTAEQAERAAAIQAGKIQPEPEPEEEQEEASPEEDTVTAAEEAEEEAEARQ